MIKKIFILIAMMSFTSLSFAIEIVNQEKDKMQEKGITELIITDNKVGDGREAEKVLLLLYTIQVGSMRMERKPRNLIVQLIEESHLALSLELDRL